MGEQVAIVLRRSHDSRLGMKHQLRRWMECSRGRLASKLFADHARCDDDQRGGFSDKP